MKNTQKEQDKRHCLSKISATTNTKSVNLNDFGDEILAFLEGMFVYRNFF